MPKHFRNEKEMLKELRACYRMFKYQVFLGYYIEKPNWPGFTSFFLWNLVDLLCLSVSAACMVGFMITIFIYPSFAPLLAKGMLSTATILFFCLHIPANRNCYKSYYEMVETGFFNDLI